MLQSLINETEIANISAYAAASNTGTTTSSAIDMAGYESATVLVKLGIVSTGGLATCKLQQSSDDAVADGYSDIEGSELVSIGDASTLKFLALEIINPQKRYIKCLVSRSVANVVIDGIFVIKYGAKGQAVTQGSTVDGSVQIVAPAEGTA